MLKDLEAEKSKEKENILDEMETICKKTRKIVIMENAKGELSIIGRKLFSPRALQQIIQVVRANIGRQGFIPSPKPFKEAYSSASAKPQSKSIEIEVIDDPMDIKVISCDYEDIWEIACIFGQVWDHIRIQDVKING